VIDMREQRRHDTRQRLQVMTARTPGDLVDAQRLRWRVFADELGASLTAPRSGVDSDRFDAFCDHLIVRDNHSGEVVGTYRLLNLEQAGTADGPSIAEDVEMPECCGRIRDFRQAWRSTRMT